MKTTLVLAIALFFSIPSFSQDQRMAAWRCKTFNVSINLFGVTIGSEVTVCCGCNSYGLCNCTASKNVSGSFYDGYIVVDDILKNKKPTSDYLTITKSSQVYNAEDGLTYTIMPGDYKITNGDDNHKVIVVKVTGK